MTDTPDPRAVAFHDLVVFTRDGKGGNPLAFIEADAVPEDRRTEIAAAIGYSETVFAEHHPARVHIFTPAGRLPFAGHPLVGSAYAYGRGVDRIAYDAGVAQVAHSDDGVAVTVVVEADVETVPPPPFGVEAAMARVPQPYRVVHVADVATVESMDPTDLAGLGEVYVWAWERPGEVVRSRFFLADLGLGEDAATGSAAAALTQVLPDKEGSLVVHQGEEIGRPSRIDVSWRGSSVTLGGRVTDAGMGAVTLD